MWSYIKLQYRLDKPNLNFQTSNSVHVAMTVFKLVTSHRAVWLRLDMMKADQMKGMMEWAENDPFQGSSTILQIVQKSSIFPSQM